MLDWLFLLYSLFLPVTECPCVSLLLFFHLTDVSLFAAQSYSGSCDKGRERRRQTRKMASNAPANEMAAGQVQQFVAESLFGGFFVFFLQASFH